MIELDRLRYDLVHSVPAARETGSQPPQAGSAPPWMATLAGTLLAGYGLTRSRGFAQLGLLSASAGLLFYGWSRSQPTTQLDGPPLEPSDDHPLDVAGHGSFPASDPPSLTPRT